LGVPFPKASPGPYCDPFWKGFMQNFCTWCHQGGHAIEIPGTPALQDPIRCPKCPLCHRAISLVGITSAARVMNVSRKTIYQWIEKGLVTTCRTASGRQLVCYSSLFRVADADDNES
jgi:excisionase family DNA binding protein